MSLRRSSVLLVITALIAFTGCGSSDSSNENNTTAEKAHVRVLHASPDAPAVNVMVNGSAALEGVDYMQGSALIPLDQGTYSVQVDGILPDMTTTTVIGPVDLDFMAGTRYDIMAVNSVASIEPLIIETPIETVAEGMARVVAVHASAAAPAVDLYVTAPGADLASAAPLGTFEFKGSLGPVTVPAGDYQIRVTVAGTKTVVFDSGSVALAGDLVAAAVPNTGNGDAPIALVIMDGTGSAVIHDAATPASLRVVHDSADAPAVDIVVNNNFSAPLVEDLAFPEATPYVDVPSDTYNVKVAAANTETVVIDANLTLDAGTVYTVMAVNALASIEPLVLTDNTRRVATEAKVRLVHGSPTAGNVDIYVTAPDADITSAEPTFTDVPFKAETGFVSLTTGDYQVRITPTGTKTVAIDTGALSLAGGGIYTAIARDNAGGGTPLGVIVMDDFVAP
jgi:hypothetical protein